MQPWWKFLVASVVVGLANQAVAIETAPVEQAPFIETIQLDGVIEAVRKATVSAQTSGQVLKVYFDVDDAVAPHELLVELDSTEHKARLVQAQASLKEAQAGLADAQQNFQRIEGIHQRNLASQAQLDQAQNQLHAAEARQSRAQAAVAEAQQQLDYTRITAPYGGIMTERHVEEGAMVAVGQPLMSGLSLQELRVVTAVPQRYAASARISKTAQVSLGAGRILPTSNITFYPYADPTTHTFRVRLQLDNPAGDLFPGMLVKVNLPVAEREAIYIPSSALVSRGELRAVYVLDKQRKPRLRQIRLGTNLGAKIEVLAGLAAGEILVLNPAAVLASLESDHERN